MTRFLLIVAAVLATACSSDPAKRKTVAVQEVARMRAPQVSLSEYGKFELTPMAMSAEVANQPEKAAIAKEVEKKLDARLQPLLRGWEANAPADKANRQLRIQPRVVSMHVVSSGARFFAGAWSGDSTIDMDLKLVDTQSGQTIADERIRRSADAMSGAWSVGATDQNLLDYIVDIAYEYLLKNHQ